MGFVILRFLKQKRRADLMNRIDCFVCIKDFYYTLQWARTNHYTFIFVVLLFHVYVMIQFRNIQELFQASISIFENECAILTIKRERKTDKHSMDPFEQTTNFISLILLPLIPESQFTIIVLNVFAFRYKNAFIISMISFEILFKSGTTKRSSHYVCNSLKIQTREDNYSTTNKKAICLTITNRLT